ncbi:serine/threonine-protein kinase TNNI3K-like, partial [Stylophora pistillata]|uniref:serine/threonine-protein kinase TNNI3K-like n=1 Tax=Stylophora pistillata TaxID=50429 RepID=UPI000C043B1D
MTDNPDNSLEVGAWGRVVRGKFRRTKVAVKEIHQVLLSDENSYIRESFEVEVGIASRCRHPCLLQFIGASIDAEGLLLITELMDRSLRSLYEEQPLLKREVCIISLDVVQALNYLHKSLPHPIIHRDISSANVLLWRQNDQWRAKVSDYGNANYVRQSRKDGPGSAVYSAPEATDDSTKQNISCK